MGNFPPGVHIIYSLLHGGKIPCLTLKVLRNGLFDNPGAGAVYLNGHFVELVSNFRVKPDCGHCLQNETSCIRMYA